MASGAEKSKWNDIKIRARKEWESFIKKGRPRILVGSATCGRACGSQDVIGAVRTHLKKRNLKIPVTEVGCLGLCYAEVLMEVVDAKGVRVLYSKVTPESACRIIDGFLVKAKPEHELALAAMGDKGVAGIDKFAELAMIKPQVRVALRNCGRINPKNIYHYISNGGYDGLVKALGMDGERVVGEVRKSGLRGRGGAGFPTWKKWELCRNVEGGRKYLVCNADEGDPGAFMDRALLEGDPHSVIEGMVIGAYAIGASRGYIYARAEYPLAIETLEAAIKQAEELGLLGDNILGSGFNFHLSMKKGAGAFVCGEETALIASIEGKRGMPRTRPPFPAQKGVYGKPTNINNVETFANVSSIISKGSKWYSSLGTENSRGTKTFSLAGKIVRTGLIEVPMGISLHQIIYDIGGGIPGGKKFKALQTGGPSGGCLPVSMLDLPVDYDNLSKAGSIMGSGGMIVMDEDTCMVDLAHIFLEFTYNESCGKCSPCRLGTKQLLEILKDITCGRAKPSDIDLLREIGYAVKNSSLCGLGQTAPNPVLTTLKYFRDEYEEHINENRCRAVVCRDIVIAPCRHTCPAGIDVPKYVRAVRDGRFGDALAVIMEKIPFPAVCGYVCYHPCEAKCRRGEVDEAVAIRALKRFVSGRKADVPSGPGKTGRKAAVIGSGPAGLTAAYYLARLGHDVTVFEAFPKPGGMLRVGIPRYRLPEKVIDDEIKRIVETGVKIKTSSPVKSISKLLRQGFNAVLLAPGAHKGIKMGIKGEDLPAVMDCIEFLRDVSTGRKVKVGRRVGVVGGGNAAIDTARTALRLGAGEVTIIYRRSREQMPASPEEVEEALFEKIRIMFLTNPVKIMAEKKQKTSSRLVVSCVKMELGPVGSDGRATVKPVPASDFEMELDTLIMAIGQSHRLPVSMDCETDRRGRIRINGRSTMTSRNGVFAAGDAVTGPASIIEAIAAGRKSAVSIDRYLGGKGIIDEVLAPQEDLERIRPVEEESSGMKRVNMKVLPAGRRNNSFALTELGYGRNQAIKEASRCLNCDLEDNEG